MARYSEREKDGTKEAVRARLLEAAAAEISRYGFDGAKIDRISTTAGFGKGTVYNYFPGKRSLMEAFMTDFARRHAAALIEAVLRHDDAGARLTEFFTTGFDWIRENLSEARIVVSTLFGPDDEFRMHLHRAYEPLFRLLAEDILETGMRDGRFRRIDAGKITGLIMSVYLGTAAQITGDEGTLPLPGELVAEFASAYLTGRP